MYTSMRGSHPSLLIVLILGKKNDWINVYLSKGNKNLNKRSVYYQAVPIFKSQNKVNSLISYFMKKFNCEMSVLNILAGSKGIFNGELIFITENKEKLEIQGHNLNLTWLK